MLENDGGRARGGGDDDDVNMTTTTQFDPLVCLGRIVFGCCGWTAATPLAATSNNAIGGGEALGGENRNQQSINNVG